MLKLDILDMLPTLWHQFMFLFHDNAYCLTDGLSNWVWKNVIGPTGTFNFAEHLWDELLKRLSARCYCQIPE